MKNHQLDILSIGLSKENCAILDEMLRLRSGAILIAGVTGSGKTTTAYAMLERARIFGRSVASFENPIEANLAGIIQNEVACNNSYGEFGKAIKGRLSSIDAFHAEVVMIGEIRDTDAAETAIDLAKERLVIFPLRTHDAVGGLLRLLDMQVNLEKLSSAIACLISQRLVKQLCHYCRRKVEISENVIDADTRIVLGRLAKSNKREIDLYEPIGCGMCEQSGYLGSTGIFEVIEIDSDIRDVLLSGDAMIDTAWFRTYCYSKASTTLRDDGILKALDGITSISEVLRVTWRN